MINKYSIAIKERKLRLRPFHHRQPGIEQERPVRQLYKQPESRREGKLEGRVAMVTDGDSAVGRALAVAFAKEGADVVITYMNEECDAEETVLLVRGNGRHCIKLKCDVAEKSQCDCAIESVICHFGRLDILLNIAAEVDLHPSINAHKESSWVDNFRSNIFSMFFLVAAALPHLKKSPDAAIINTSVSSYHGNRMQMGYLAMQGAIVRFTRSLASQLADVGIRVNGVAPLLELETPLIAATFSHEKIGAFDWNSPMDYSEEAQKCADCCLFLACKDSSHINGQVFHPNGIS